MSSISFCTAVCHKDWKALLCEGLLESRLYNIGYEFDEVNVFVNNVDDVKGVMNVANSLDFVNRVFDSASIKDEVLGFFDVEMGDEVWYSVAPFSAIYYSRCEYIFFITPDSDVQTRDTSFVQDSMEVLKDPVVLTTPSWQGRVDGGLWKMDQTISDQCFMMKSDVARSKIYNESTDKIEKYPVRAGESFEKRLCAYIRAKNLKRAIHTKSHYIHKNF